jgi:hypothetical protein
MSVPHALHATHHCCFQQQQQQQQGLWKLLLLQRQLTCQVLQPLAVPAPVLLLLCLQLLLLLLLAAHLAHMPLARCAAYQSAVGLHQLLVLLEQQQQGQALQQLPL